MTNQSETRMISSQKSSRTRTSKQYLWIGTQQYFGGVILGIGIILKTLLWDIAICGTCKLFVFIARIITRVVLLFWSGFVKTAYWLENTSHQNKQRFWKSYTSVIGVMLALIGNGVWLNIKSDAAWGRSFRAQLPTIQQIHSDHASMSNELTQQRENSGENLLQKIVLNEASRLPISCSVQQAQSGLINFANFVVELESKGDQFAVSRSGAVGYTQFLRSYKGKFNRGPMDTGINRWNSYTERASISTNTPWFNRTDLRENPYRFMGIPLAAQQAFMLVNIAEESGNDQNLALTACGDARAATYLYVYKHHRDPGKEKYIWENVESKISAFYPNHKLDFSLRENALKTS